MNILEHSGIRALRQFACIYIAEEALNSVSLEGVLDFQDLEGDPDYMDVAPPLRINVNRLEDALGDYFVDQGSLLIWYAYSMLDAALQVPATRAYIWSGIQDDVSQTIAALCGSGDIYRRRRSHLGEVVLILDGIKVVLARNLGELQRVAESNLPYDTLIELQEQASDESS